MYWDKPKNSVPYENAFSGGFFAYYAEVESGIKKRFTLPVSNICADQGGNVPSLGRKYINEWTNSRGLLNGKVKMSCNQNGNAGFKDKKVSTLIVCNDNSAKIIDTNTLPSDCKYALSGVPVIREKNDVNWKSYVIPMGWSSSVMYATFRNFIGIKGDKMFTISGKTTSNNYIFGCEFINKIQPTLELDDCIGIDGGGSFFHRDKGRFISRTLENRPINNIITF